MKLATPGQMSAMDHYAIEKLGIPGIVLMENAALKVVEEIVETLEGVEGRRILLLAGKGNNGGDALAAARHLANRGACVMIHLFASGTEAAGDAKINLDIVKKMKVPVMEYSSHGSGLSLLHEDIHKADLIVDGIFGTGLKGEVAGVLREVILAVNAAGKPVIAIDIPSGVSGENGKVLGACIHAAKTVTFGLPKIGLLVEPGCEHVGKLVVADIGIPREAVEQQAIPGNVLDGKLVREIIPIRGNNTNKGNYGKLLIVTGSTGMTGSGCLCARAALRSGSGLVYTGVPASLAPIYGAAQTEPILLLLEDHGQGVLSADCADRLLEHLARMDAAVAGPGLTAVSGVRTLVERLVEESRIPLVLDADALNVLSTDLAVLDRRKAECVITPHPGEMARLTGKTIEEIQQNRLEVACEFAARWSVVVVLKGWRTLVAAPDGTFFVNTTGNPGMATGGTGDVLAGVIGSLIGQGIKPLEAAAAGVYLHGLAGDMAAKRLGQHGLIAGDVVEMLPYAILKTTGE